MGKNKGPKVRLQPNPQKQPRAASKPMPSKQPKVPHIRGGPLTWRFSAIDKGGPFSWSALEDAGQYKSVMEQLHNFETMEEQSIGAAGSHRISKDKLCKDAQDRLSTIELDDLDELFSFRLSGKTRVWCRINGSTMIVLWWDPEHAVCPSVLKHT